MCQIKSILFGLLALAGLASSVPASAATVRVEYVRVVPTADGAQLGPVDQMIDATGTLSVTAAAPLTGGARLTVPTPASSSILQLYARVTVLDGAVIVRKGGDAAATGGGLYAGAGGTVHFPVEPGDQISMIETTAAAAVTGGYDAAFNKMVVGTARDKFRDSFRTFDTVENWELVQTGPGQTISLGGVAGGSRYLNIATGVTASSETILLSRQSFKLPVKFGISLSMSQRIANQEVYADLVSVDAAGAVETDTAFPSTNLNNAANAISFKFDGTDPVRAIYPVRGYGVSELSIASSPFGISTVATGTSPNFAPTGIWEINADMEEVVWQTRSIDSLGAAVQMYRRTQNLPDPAKDYKVRLRVRNLGTAPASTTDVRFHFVRVLDTTRMDVSLSRYMGRATDAADAHPVAVTNSLSAGLVASSSLIGDVGINYRNNATGAALSTHIVSAAGTNATVVKNSAGRLLGWSCGNTSAAAKFAKIHNTSAAPVPGTGVLRTIMIPANGVNTMKFEGGMAQTTGIGLTITGGVADADVTAVNANDVVCDVYFQ